MKQEPAVEEVGDDPPRRHRGLTDRGVPDEAGVRDRRPLAEHGLGQRAVEREAQPISRDRLVQRRVALGERQGRRGGEAHSDLQILEPGRLRRRADRDAHGRFSRAREHLARRHSERLVEHPVARSNGSGARCGGLRERLERRARLRDFVLGRGERIPQRLQLHGMDRPLAVEPERAGMSDSGAERVVVAHGQVRPVDRLDARRAGGDEQRVLREAPVLRCAAARSSERRGEIRVAEDQAVQARRRARDLAGRGEPGRRLDQREQPNRLRAPGCGLGPVEQPVGEREIVRMLDLGHDGRDRPARARRQGGEVEVAPRRADRIHPHGDRRRRPLCPERHGDGRPRVVLGGRHDGVLEVEHDLVRDERCALRQLRARSGGNHEAGATTGSGLSHTSALHHRGRSGYAPRAANVRETQLVGPLDAQTKRLKQADRPAGTHSAENKTADLRFAAVGLSDG